MSLPTRDERGLALPSPVVVLTIVAIAMAAVAFLVTGNGGGRDDKDSANPAAVSSPSGSGEPSSTASADPSEGSSPDEATPSTSPGESASGSPSDGPSEPADIDRSAVLVEVYNNSTISGLAGRTADDARSVGWNVVGVDNWHGTIPESTVYYPDGMEADAETLADDLGISRLNPAVEPMRFDRLTVILTGS